jgi:L-ascorbate metabolism protein UlaG (beta-lactamase superfamily)
MLKGRNKAFGLRANAATLDNPSTLNTPSTLDTPATQDNATILDNPAILDKPAILNTPAILDTSSTLKTLSTLDTPPHKTMRSDMMHITWYGHSAFRLDFAGQSVLIDPFFTGNPAFTIDRAQAIKGVSHILITHGHGDHVGDALAIAAENDATVISNYEICVWLAAQGLKKYDPMNSGGTIHLDGFAVSMVKADHSSAHFDGANGVPLGNPNGVIVKPEGGKSVYHMGDTDIFGDMALIQEIHQPQIGLVPIGDRFTMGGAVAALAVKRYFAFETVIPCHYGTFGLLDQTPDHFIAGLKDSKTKVLVPEKGQKVAV